MKIIFKYILNNLRDQKLRSLVMLLSITLSSTLLFVSLSLGASYAAAQRKMALGMAGSAAIAVTAGEKGIAKDVIPLLSSVKSAVGMVSTIALYKEDGYYENFDVIAANVKELNAINPPRLLGGASLDGFTGNEIVLPDRFASKFNIAPGGSLTLWIGGRSYEFTVAAIAAYDTVFLRNTRGTNALVPIETLSAILGMEGKYTQLLIEPADGITAGKLQSLLQERLQGPYTVKRIVNEAQLEADGRQKSIPFYLISFFSLTMSVFIIYSSYKVITLERLPVIGTFRSIGATEKIMTRILLLESFVYGVAGALLSIPAGFLVLRLLLDGLGNSMTQGISIPMIVSPENYLLACGTAVVTSVMSSWIPVKRVSRLPVKEVVLGLAEEQVMPDRKRFIFGAAFIVLSILVSQASRLMDGNIQLMMGGFSILGLLVAAITVIPAVVSGASALFEHIYGRLLGNVGRLAARNMRGNRNINQNITLLFISISAVIVIMLIASFAQVYIGDVFRGAKLDGFCDADMTPGFVEDIKALDGIGEVLPVRVMNNQVKLNGAALSRVEGTDDISGYGEMFAVTYEFLKNLKNAESAFASGRNILLSAERMKELNVHAGETVTLSSEGSEYPYTVIGSFKVRSTSADAIIPSAFAYTDFGVENYFVVAYTAPDPNAVMAQIRSLFGNRSNWSRTVDEFNADAMGTINAFFAPMRNLTWFILVLATVGIMNNLLINHIQKRREHAMYKSVGLSNAQNVKMTLAEAFASGLVGALFAILVSWLEINTIFLVAGPRIAVSPDLDVSTFLLAGALGIGITLIGAVMPLMKSRRMKIVEELKFE
jgi:ABC-type antimicrobial peptide transport system permease subunit